ncbi:hypothetical protein AB0A74_38930 [Saccharothrix sp. NPDC042600]|uniref:hypothetical protein n=1 Tax=Saccharothrix TaxID=2071 RepID=UPI00340812CF|nr:hypothetical protein GCM10017745_51180 [Saccharothrix mutabilis subsp. capreolus]
MRHRAVLLALVGGGCVVAAFRAHLRPAAVVANTASCGSFLLIALAGAPVNGELTWWLGSTLRRFSSCPPARS